ncbi:GNAT family N-acetyltransferase [Myxococcota bacterium]|nr:GNAT family N-acetyltransferase [Myxococcota bacterium]MBU1379261.1 GNAT family N-acetyltransferase [Myxococcota bacterium]MBU1496206.1 GNAT family N-acetyltransferase [Myxococcota bacterium]
MTFYNLQKKDLKTAGIVLADAFIEDPIWEAFIQKTGGTRKIAPLMFETPARFCLHYGKLFATSPAMEGIAGTLPGHLSSMSFLRILRSGAIFPAMSIGMKAGKLMKQIFEGIEKDRKELNAGFDFNYLQVIGVRKTFQHQGLGKKLLNDIVSEADLSGKHIYLETETLENVAMYEKYGFKVLRQITLPVLNLPMWEMRRPPISV